MEEYLSQIVKPLLTEPESLKITKTTDEMGVLLRMDIAQPDMGFIIGKQGQSINKIRQIMYLYGVKNDAKIAVKINEPQKYDRTNDNTGGY